MATVKQNFKQHVRFQVLVAAIMKIACRHSAVVGWVVFTAI
jgi:hypothetical protein